MLDSVLGFGLHLGRPWALLLFGIVLLVANRIRQRPNTQQASFWFSRCKELAALQPGLVARWSRVPLLLRLIALSLIVVSLANPKSYTGPSKPVAGIDIMIVLDLSQSMEELSTGCFLSEKHRVASEGGVMSSVCEAKRLGFSVLNSFNTRFLNDGRTRLETGQRTITEFLRARSGLADRVGLVVFAEQALLSCPLTLDHESLGVIVAELNIGDVPPLGTAIGDALGVALASLRRTKNKSGVIVLLSDGAWNKAQYMDPGEARDLAVELGVTVFSVLLGHQMSDADEAQHGVNPVVLRELAAHTSGLYFHAENEAQLGTSFEAIHMKLLETPQPARSHMQPRQLFDLFLWPALALLVLEFLLRMTRFRSFP